jgi:hypothetical protein
MNFQKPVMEQLPEMKLPDTESIKTSVASTIGNISSSVGNIQNNLNNVVSEFSQKSVVGASQEFLNANTIIAKFVFIVLVLIGFMFLINLAITLMGYFMQPSTTPYLINGMINGNNGIIITQDPTNVNSIPIKRSNNETTGIEFTWSVWLLITNPNTLSSTKYQNIFNKGDIKYDTSSGISLVNGPGIYLAPANVNSKNENVLHVVMDQVDGVQNTMDISGVPMNKWFHLALRMENKIMDAYVNGIVYSRSILSSVPKQNYYNINIGQNGGFAGSISNLRYFDSALAAVNINSIVATGANTSSSRLSLQNASTIPASLSSLWYKQSS